MRLAHGPVSRAQGPPTIAVIHTQHDPTHVGNVPPFPYAAAVPLDPRRSRPQPPVHDLTLLYFPHIFGFVYSS